MIIIYRIHVESDKKFTQGACCPAPPRQHQVQEHLGEEHGGVEHPGPDQRREGGRHLGAHQKRPTTGGTLESPNSFADYLG